RATGQLDPAAYRALLRRARVYVTAPRREDYGVAQLEALADGCVLVTTDAPGPYAALPLARALDPRLRGDDLAGALRTALDDPAPGYAERALAALAPYRRAAADAVVRDELLPALLSGARASTAP
ncbi:MAG: glycosyltransferase, partial [Solirubrobacteraceae bacterium]